MLLKLKNGNIVDRNVAKFFIKFIFFKQSFIFNLITSNMTKIWVGLGLGLGLALTLTPKLSTDSLLMLYGDLEALQKEYELSNST